MKNCIALRIKEMANANMSGSNLNVEIFILKVVHSTFKGKKKN
jgi:hypothetical protein